MVFLDSGFLIAIAIASDQHHNAADKALRQFVKNKTRLFTSNYVLQETITRIVYAAGSHTIEPFVSKIDELERQDLLGIIWIDRMLHNKSLKILLKYKDHPFSFVDASIIAIVKYLKLEKIYTTDKTLQQSGLDVVVL